MLTATSGATNTTCLQDPDPSLQTITLNMCGNGIVESGEECDPGPNVNSTCCDYATCKFTAGAVCDYASSTCCTSSCQFAPSTLVCRPAVDATCDIPEYCTGNSSACPADKFTTNGVFPFGYGASRSDSRLMSRQELRLRRSCMR